jgi:HSP20 family protein
VVNLSEADRRKNLRDMLDELDKYFEELEKDLQDSVRRALVEGRHLTGPFVGGFAMQMGPEGPSIQFFGDDPQQSGGFRSPLSEQMVDEKEGVLRVLMDLPGVDKDDIGVSATERSVAVKAEQASRRYRCELELKAEVDPDTGRAEYKNGVLQISFSLRDKSNKGARRVSVV